MIEEAMERAITLVTPEDTRPIGNMKQNTTGKGIPSSSFSPSRSDTEVESRYLRPSMASCHDNCKYVKKLDYEAASQNFRTFRKKNIVPKPNGEESRKGAITKMRMEVESKPESDFSDQPSFSKPKAQALTKKSITPTEKKTFVTSQGNRRNQDKSLNLDNENKMKAIGLIAPLHPQSSLDKPNVVNLTNLTSPDSETKQKAPPSSENPQNIKRKAPLPLERVDATARFAILLKAKTLSISHLKSQEDKQATKSFGFLKLGGVASKHPLNSLETKAPLPRSISARRNQERIGEGAAGPANTLKTKSLPVKSASHQLKPSLFSSKAPPLDVVSILKPGKVRNAKNSTPVKTKHKPGGANAKKSEATESESVANGSSRKEISKVGNKRGARRSLEDTISMPYKLKFRQGKVMDLRGDSSTGATRLLFRFGKVMGGDNPSDNNLARRRSFRKKKDIGDSDSNPPSSEAQTVILKHQEAEIKKDAQALLNRMIEETASRLVDVRKSKVKALVGAFETVMSRQ